MMRQYEEREAPTMTPSVVERWSGRRGSNPRHPAWEAGVLPLNYSRSGCVNQVSLSSLAYHRSRVPTTGRLRCQAVAWKSDISETTNPGQGRDAPSTSSGQALGTAGRMPALHFSIPAPRTQAFLTAVSYCILCPPALLCSFARGQPRTCSEKTYVPQPQSAAARSCRLL
jgi:hypothetical protein